MNNNISQKPNRYVEMKNRINAEIIKIKSYYGLEEGVENAFLTKKTMRNRMYTNNQYNTVENILKKIIFYKGYNTVRI